MTQPVIVFLGAASDQAPSYRTAREMGFHIIGIDGNPQAFAFKYADETHVISVRDHEAIQRVLGDRKIDGFYSQASDAARLSEFHLTRAFGAKKTVSMDSVEASSNKAFFVDTLKSIGLARQKQLSGTSVDAMRRSVSDWTPPFVVKPNDSSGSKGVRIIDDPAEFEDAFAAAMGFSPTGIVLCEELISGTHYSVDSFIRNHRPEFMTISHKTLTEHPLMVPLHYVMPAGVSPELEQRLGDCVSKICVALNIAAGPITCDVVVGGDGEIYFIEMGARAGGNGISLLMERAYGPNYVKASVGLVAGLDIPVRASRNRHAGLITIASPVPGRFRSVKGLDRLAGENLICESEIFYEPGDPIEKFTNGANKLGYVIVEADSAQDLRARLGDVRHALKVEIESDGAIIDVDLL